MQLAKLDCLLSLRFLILTGLLAALGLARADDYVLDPAPKLETGTALALIDYERPEDPRVCGIYLENLRYFAQRNTPMSCERPIAPHLQDRIQKVEWENLDPDGYPELYRAVALRFLGKDVSQGAMNKVSGEIRRGAYVFRRAKLDLIGYPGYEDHGGITPRPERFHIVQFGRNVIDPDNPDRLSRCTLQRGGPIREAPGDLQLYVVRQDLKFVIGRLSEPHSTTTGEHMRLINGRPYVETINTRGNIELMQIRLALPVMLEPVCFFWFKKSEGK